MDRLSRLRKPLLDMTREEQYDLIRRIRADRRLVKERPSVRKKAARSSDKDKTNLSKLLAGMTPEEIKALLGDQGDDAN